MGTFCHCRDKGPSPHLTCSPGHQRSLPMIEAKRWLFWLKQMTQEAQLCWRQTAGKTPVPPCPTAVQGFGGEASGRSPSQGYALVSRAQESPKRVLSCTTALTALFTKLPCSSSATSEWMFKSKIPTALPVCPCGIPTAY